MRQSSRHNVNLLCRVGLAIFYLHVLAVASCRAEQLIDEAVIRKWSAYERFARSLQATMRMTQVSITGSNAAKERRFQIIWKQNQNCVSSCRSTEEEPNTFISIANPQYAAELRRSKSNPGDIVLQRFSESPQQAPVFEQVIAAVSPHFSVAGTTPLGQILDNPHFKILKMTKISEKGRDLVRLDYRSVSEPSGLRFVNTGWVDLDPARCWCIVRSRRVEERTRKNGARASDGVLEVKLERLYGKKALVYAAFRRSFGYLNTGCGCSVSGL